MSYKIGKVQINTDIQPPRGSRPYSDGAEEELLNIYKSKNSEELVLSQLSREDLSWPMYYHLSPTRGSVISPFKFKKNAKVLEIGAGCGAVTEELVKNDIQVTALELSELRAKVNAHRNKHSGNLEIVVGNTEDYNKPSHFDYVVCIGVLEYSGSYIKGIDPYREFINILSQYLKPGGLIIIAIENRLGLKYIRGEKEDHTGRFFDGLNNYPSSNDIKTFSRTELTNLLEMNNLNVVNFYYPYPDYKTPVVIYSDDFLPGKDTQFNIGLLSTKQKNSNGIELFNEKSAMIEIEKDGLFKNFANSFIVLAEKIK